MTKKEYMKPAMRTVELKHRMRILNASNFGVNRTLQEEISTDPTTGEKEYVTDAW